MSAESSPGNIPDLVKHVTIAVLEKGVKGSNKLDKFVNALAIARGKLSQWGYIEGGATGPVEDIKLTAKGVTRNFKHAGERGRKTDEFDRLFVDLQAANRGHELSAHQPPPPGSPPVQAPPKEKKLAPRERRLSPQPQPLRDRKLVVRVTKAKAKSVPKAKKAKRA